MTRRVTHLITSLGGGGTENFLFQILQGSPSGYEHEVLYLGQDGVIGERIRHLGISVKHVNPLAFYTRMKHQKPDVLHTCLHWAHQVGRMAGHQAKLPMIVSSHRSIDVWQKPWHRLMDQWTLPWGHAVIVNSEAARRVIEDRLQRAAHRPLIHRICNGLDGERFRNTARTEARRAMGISEEDCVGGTLMRLHPEKGAEKIPAYARALLNRYPKLRLFIAGNGPMEGDLLNQTKDLGNRIQWVGWQEDSVRFLSALDYFWLLSREESFPQALLEASGAGIPWIAPDVGDVRELATSGASGIVFSPNSAEEAVRATEVLLQDLAALKSKAQHAMAGIQEKYSLKSMISTFFSIIGASSNQRGASL